MPDLERPESADCAKTVRLIQLESCSGNKTLPTENYFVRTVLKDGRGMTCWMKGDV